MILMTPDELEQRLSDPDLRLIDVRQGEAYAMGHIPGARNFSLYGINTYDTDPAPLASFVHSWAFLLGRCGVAPDTRVVLYEDISGMTAARGFWFLEYLGHERVHILDGGLKAWVSSGYDLTRDAELPQAVNYPYRLQDDRVAGYADVLDAIGQPDRLILDTRADWEWFGSRPAATNNGTIPGAVHLEWINNLDREGRFKSLDALRELYTEVGVTSDKEVIALCNTGYRSAHAYVAMRLMGYPKIRNYVGSWQEWGNRAGMPIVTPTDPVRAPLE